MRSSVPLLQLLEQIEHAADHGLELLAISMAVALPDMCVSLSSEDGRSDGRRYKEWCADNLASDKFGFLTPDDLYSMRCGVLHNGRFGDLQHSVSRVIFPLPGPAQFTNCLMNDTYLYSPADFCRNLCGAVREWYVKHFEDARVKANMARMMAYHSNGLAPHFRGFPVIA